MGKVRLELVADFGPRRGQTFSGVVVEPEYDAILQAALNKLKAKKKADLFLVLRDKYQGTKLLSREADLQVLLRDGATVVLTTQRPAAKLQRPPRWPWPGGKAKANAALGADADDDGLDQEAGGEAKDPVPRDSASKALRSVSPVVELPVAGALQATPACEEPPALGEWCGPWPVLQGSVLAFLREAVGGQPGFTEKSLGEYLAFDYYANNAAELPAMFPDPRVLPKRNRARLLAAVRRECRGLLVCASTGKLLARRLPKFFNVDEMEEVRLDSLPASGGFATEKMDGSLVSPFLLGDAVRWAGKSALVPAVEDFVSQRPLLQQVAELVRRGQTPIFEWCEAGHTPGVIRHQESRLVLIAVRDMASGEFWADERLRALGCDIVEKVPFDDLCGLVCATRQRIGVEGLVVAWPTLGCMVKVKTTWWVVLSSAQGRGRGQPAVALQAALQELPLSSVPAPAVWHAALASDDDQMALVYSCLAPPAQAGLRAFLAAVEKGVQVLDQELREWAECVRDASPDDLARIAGGWPHALLGAYHRRAPNAERELRRFLARLAVVGDLAALEALAGTSWNGSRQPLEYCGHLGTFERAPEEVVDHVLSQYLSRKMQDYLGHPIEEETLVHVQRMYIPSEGKIAGMWERFASKGRKGIIDLRVDLQPRSKTFDFHNGDPDFAHWQVQFGPNDKCPRSTKAKEGDAHGAFAGVLLRTGVDVEFGQLRDAMKLSFESRKVVKLDPCPLKISGIFLDLDGVLVDFDAGFAKDYGEVPEPKVRWQHIERTPGFYEQLPWTKDGRRLWAHVQQTALPVTILTGVPEGDLGERSAREKVAWVARELGPSVEVVTCLSREKIVHSSPGKLLIDDRPMSGWEAAGGRQILHRDVLSTLLELAGLGLGRSLALSRADVAVISSLTEELRAASAQADVVALDVEWAPDRAGAAPNSAAVLQLAFRPRPSLFAVFVIDALAWDSELQAFVRELLTGDLPKLVFGQGDAERLGMPIAPVTDLQEDLSMSLGVQARRSGIILEKAKELQASDWSARPLRQEQILYAAADALVLLELAAEDCSSLAGRRPAKEVPHAPEMGRKATVEYTGVFLTAEARQKLLRRVPPRFSEVRADHMTLAWHPATAKGLAVGAPVKLRVEGIACNDRVQAVSVATLEAAPRRGHVTLSHRSDAAAVDAGELDFDSLADPLVLEGVLGAAIVLGGGDAGALPDALSARLNALVECQPGQSEQFEGLTDSQRYALHLLADELGLEHRSEGKKGTQQRKIIVTVPKRVKKQPNAGAKTAGERLVVKDPKKFANLFGDIPGLHLHGRVTRTGVEWEPGAPVPQALAVANPAGGYPAAAPAPAAVILRGFPGSGKSHLTRHLCKLLGAAQICADDFWRGKEHVHEAHAQCRELFQEALARREMVVVDNTNVRLSDYAFYKSRAEAAGFSVIVLEIICESTTELERLRRRSVHAVPGDAVGAMWSRWERDPAALRLAPYVPQELMPWLCEQGMIGRTPYTHLVMPSGPFLGIPAARREEFHQRFEADWGRNYISEQASPQAFQLFFDVDGGLGLARLVKALEPLRALAGGSLVVTGTTEAPAGYHVFAPGRVVDVAEALSVRQQWIEQEPWLEEHVDSQVYQGGKQHFLQGGGGPHLRLLGSRKNTKEGMDSGRVHRVLGRLGAAGWEPDATWAWSDVSILP